VPPRTPSKLRPLLLLPHREVNISNGEIRQANFEKGIFGPMSPF
jgi:hypothetical protein